MVNQGGGHFQKNLSFFYKNISFWVDFNVLYFLFFFEQLSFIFPYKMRMFFLTIDIKIKRYIFFSFKFTLFVQKEVRVMMGK